MGAGAEEHATSDVDSQNTIPLRFFHFTNNDPLETPPLPQTTLLQNGLIEQLGPQRLWRRPEDANQAPGPATIRHAECAHADRGTSLFV